MFKRWIPALCATLVGVAAGPVSAQTAFPTQPIRLVVPFAAGGGSDTLARSLTDAVSRQLGQPVIVENKPGGGTNIAAQLVLNAPADGHTVMVNTASFVINKHLMAKHPFEPLKDFVPVTLMAASPHLLVVHPSVPASDLKSFIAWAKAQDGKASFASFGNGSSSHLGFEILKAAGGFEMVHVAYKGAAPATADLIGGQVQAMLADLQAATEQVKGGRLKAIAVAGPARVSSLPDVPTLAEGGLAGVESRSWFGLVVRAGTPAAAVTRLHAAFTQAIQDPGTVARLGQSGLVPIASAPDDFGRFLVSESVKYGDAVKRAGLKAE